MVQMFKQKIKQNNKQFYFRGDILQAVFVFTQKKNYVVLVEKREIIEGKTKRACIFVRKKNYVVLKQHIRDNFKTEIS